MNKLLYIKASPRTGRSHSVQVADAFAEAYQENHSGAEVMTLDLFRKDLPPFDGLAVQAKYTILHGGPEVAKEKREAAIEKAREMARSF